jgi:hypothetical protein
MVRRQCVRRSTWDSIAAAVVIYLFVTNPDIDSCGTTSITKFPFGVVLSFTLLLLCAHRCFKVTLFLACITLEICRQRLMTATDGSHVAKDKRKVPNVRWNKHCHGCPRWSLPMSVLWTCSRSCHTNTVSHFPALLKFTNCQECRYRPNCSFVYSSRAAKNSWWMSEMTVL